MQHETCEIVLKGGTLVTPQGEEQGDIGFKDGKIAAVGDVPDAGEVVDVRGLHLLPGVIDTQVHFREPGDGQAEDLESGSRAALLGGVTTVFEMPNTNPPTVDTAALTAKLTAAQGRMFCDFAFYAGATAHNLSTLKILERMSGCCGIKVFMGSSTGSLLTADDETLRGILKSTGRRVAVHSEDEERLQARRRLARPGAVETHLVWRDVETALRATRRLLNCARALDRRVHVLHVTTAEEVALLERHTDWATFEVTPQHLTLSAPSCYEALGTRAQMNPPLREERHQKALWNAVSRGSVSTLGSDHAPHTLDAKNRIYPQTPSGMPGVQTLVPIMLDHVNAGRLSLSRFVALTSAGPRRLFALQTKGLLAPGYDADITLVDMGARHRIDDAFMASRCGWTPFHGRTVQGWPVGVFLRGRRVMWDREILSSPIGEMVTFAV